MAGAPPNARQRWHIHDALAVLKNKPQFAARLFTSVDLATLANLLADARALLRESPIRCTEQGYEKKCRYKGKPPVHDVPPQMDLCRIVPLIGRGVQRN